jgi:hypothetical protein
VGKLNQVDTVCNAILEKSLVPVQACPDGCIISMEEDMFLMKLIGMIVLGLLSAALSFYKKNLYVRAIDDIMGREEDEKSETRVGRGFLYGFFFPVYFCLLLTGLAALIAFLIVAGIIAAVIFVLVWVTEKILPHDWFGNIVRGLFFSVGIKGPAPSSPSDPTAATGTGCCSSNTCGTEEKK